MFPIKCCNKVHIIVWYVVLITVQFQKWNEEAYKEMGLTEGHRLNRWELKTISKLSCHLLDLYYGGQDCQPERVLKNYGFSQYPGKIQVY